MGQRAIKLKLNRRYKEKNFDTDRNILKDGKNTTIFEPACVFYEEKPRWKFWRGAKDLIFFVEGAVNALKFGKNTKEMQAFWTQAEEKELIKREMKKSLQEHKPMKWSQVIILMIPIVASLLILVKMAMHFGVF